MVKITLNGKAFGLRLNQKQIEILNQIRAENIKKIGDIYDELSEVSAEHGHIAYYDYEYENIRVSKIGTASVVSPTMGDYKKHNLQENKKIEEFFKNTCLESEIIFSLSEIKLNGENSSFLTREQKAFCRREVYRQKQRAKNLFINLILEADEVNGEKMYHISYNYHNGKINADFDTAGKYFTAHFKTEEKCLEVIKKYENELTWYFTDFEIPLKIKIKI